MRAHEAATAREQRTCVRLAPIESRTTNFAVAATHESVSVEAGLDRHAAQIGTWEKSDRMVSPDRLPTDDGPALYANVQTRVDRACTLRVSRQRRCISAWITTATGLDCMTPIPPVYVVDDDPFARKLMEQVFIEAAIPVRTFASAYALLDTVDLRSPCVLLLDVRMPGMSGLELQMELLRRAVDWPVIFLTGAADVPDAVAAMRHGALDFLEKPLDVATLVGRVREAFTRYTTPPPSTLDPAVRHRLDSLTVREREVLDLMLTGQTNKRIARILGGSFRTIEVHRARVMTKMAATTLAELVRMTFEVAPAPRFKADTTK